MFVRLFLPNCCAIFFSSLFIAQLNASEVNFNYDDSYIEGRIVGGVPQDITGRKFQVSVYYDPMICGGVLIRPSWVLTAQHCTHDQKPEMYVIRAGSNYWFKGGETRTVEKIISREYYYNTFSFDNDISLLKLSSSFPITNRIGTIGIALNQPPAGATVIISGFGKQWDSDSAPLVPFLNKIETKVMNRNECAKEWKQLDGTQITISMFCTKNDKPGHEFCRGDSGGPVTYNGKLVGLVSKVIACAKTASVSVNVAFFKKWIEQSISEYDKSHQN